MPDLDTDIEREQRRNQIRRIPPQDFAENERKPEAMQEPDPGKYQHGPGLPDHRGDGSIQNGRGNCRLHRRNEPGPGGRRTEESRDQRDGMTEREGGYKIDEPACHTDAERKGDDQKHVIQPLQNVEHSLIDKVPEGRKTRAVKHRGVFQLSGRGRRRRGGSRRVGFRRAVDERADEDVERRPPVGTGGAELALEAVDAELAEANAEVAAIGGDETGDGGAVEADTDGADAPADAAESDAPEADAPEATADAAASDDAAVEKTDDGSWFDDVLPHLQHAAPGQVRPRVDRLVAAGRVDDLRAHYLGLLARPLRNPTLMIVLADRFEDGEQHEDMPTPVQRGQALLSLAGHTFQERRGNPQLTRISGRLTDFLTMGSDPMLRRLFRTADVSALRSANVTASRGVDSEIDHLITDVALTKDRQFFAQDAGFFWEGDTIWTTRAGLRRRSGERKELREVKIPENQEAIGRAASFGDLSENSEWEAAIEEQRNLTARAMEMEEELRETDLIEEAAVIEDAVCPGTRVTYRDAESGKESIVLILGPWDEEEVLGTQVISYRAPLAQGLLGLSSGEKASVKLPGGDIELEIVSIDTPDLASLA